MKFEFATKYTSCYNNQLTISSKLYKYNMCDITLFTVLIVIFGSQLCNQPLCILLYIGYNF